jgi:hypothetical protein
LGALDEPSKIGTIIRKGLADAEPTAYAIMKALALTEEQVDGLEEAINAAGDPLEGARQWAKDNPEWCGPGSRGRRASIARVLASLDSLLPRIPSNTMFFALQCRCGNRRTCWHPYYGSAINFRLPC